MHKSKFIVLALVLLGVIAGGLVWQLGMASPLTYPQAVSRLDSLLNASPGPRAWSLAKPW